MHKPSDYSKMHFIALFSNRCSLHPLSADMKLTGEILFTRNIQEWGLQFDRPTPTCLYELQLLQLQCNVTHSQKEQKRVADSMY